MSRILPHPILTVMLLVLWLLLQQSVSVGNIVLGAVIAFFAGLATSALRLEKPKLRNIFRLVELFFLVSYDVMRSNIAVAWIILTQRRMPQAANFLRVPLDMTDTTSLAFLAIIVTSTPGTVWLEYDEERKELLLHILDLLDEEEWIGIIKNRYERRLMEIFA